MADNYLEKKMEQHRSQGGRPAPYRPRLTPRGRRPGELIVEFTPCPLLIADIDAPGMTGIAREAAAAGFKVCFSMDDIHRGTRLAETLGASFLPPSMPAPDGAVSLTPEGRRLILRRGAAALAVTCPQTPTQPLDSPADTDSPLTKSVVWGAAILANLNDFQENLFKNIKIEGLSF